METKWIVRPYGYARIIADPARSKAGKDVSRGAVVIASGEVNGPTEFVAYIEAGKSFTGWIESKHVRPYRENLRTNIVDMADVQTPDPSDAQQFMSWKGKRFVNNCGVISVAMVLGRKVSDILTRFEVRDPKNYKRIYGTGSGLTSAPDLLKIFDSESVRAETLSMPFYEAEDLLTLISEYAGVIVSCRINKYSGRLIGGGNVLHWVVVREVFPERTGYGTIGVYNPFSNRDEIYSWAEFTASCGQPYGVVVR